MTLDYETARTLLLPAIAGYGIVCLLVGYWAGSARTFASLSYGSESIWTILQTMLPFYGEPKWLRDRKARR